MENQSPATPSNSNINNILLDIILIDRTRRQVSIIYQNESREVIITEPSRMTTIPLLNNYPTKWFIPATNVTRPDSPSLSIFQIEFSTAENQNNLVTQ
ncbi:8879_t:CDS:1, partial [Acaulospora morrowiae]